MVAKSLYGEVGYRWRRRQGDLVRRLRLARGLSQTDFGADVGLTKGFVSAIETARANIPPDKVELFADALRVDLKSLAVFVAYCHIPELGALIWPGLVEVLEPPSGRHSDPLGRLDDPPRAPPP